MRKILSSEITDAVKKMCISSNCNLDNAIFNALKSASKKNQSEAAKNALGSIVENARIAKEKQVPICQDTGMAVFFVKIGKHFFVEGDNLDEAINKGVSAGYTDGFLRKSVVCDPLDRVNTNDNTPPVIHYSFNDTDKIEITLLPKGFGSENKSALKMLNPSDGRSGIIDFVVETVKKAEDTDDTTADTGTDTGADTEPDDTTEDTEAPVVEPAEGRGDLNDDESIDNKDVVILFRYVSSGEVSETEVKYDINGDNTIDNKDVVTLFRFVSTK